MKLSIEFRPEAEIELYEAFDWYEKQEPGLGARFRTEVDEMIEDINRRPSSFPKIENTRFHRAVLNKFPFVIIFAQELDTLVIASVFHTSRNPVIWRDRID
jgi:plasmid stabilization system protein ParE